MPETYKAWARLKAAWRNYRADAAKARIVRNVTRISSRPMTEADWAHFDAAFAKMDEAMEELAKIR